MAHKNLGGICTRSIPVGGPKGSDSQAQMAETKQLESTRGMVKELGLKFGLENNTLSQVFIQFQLKIFVLVVFWKKLTAL